MKNLLRSKKWTAAAIGFVFLMLAGMIALGARYCFVTDFYEEQTMFLEGEYSVDGGAWQPIDNDRQITERFHSVVFRGTLPEFEYEYFSDINLYSKNIWYTLKTADGAYLDGYTAEDRLYESGNSLAALMPNTPGYAVKNLELDILKESGVAQDTVLVFEAEYPYPVAERSFSDLFRATCSDANGAYLQFFFEALPSVLLFALVCFFGIFMFPIAGFIMGKTNYRYLTFGALCFIWGLFMIGQKVSHYLNLWITDHTVCMMIEILLNYFFIITVLFYLKSNLERSIARAIANVVATVYTLMVVAAVICHFTGIVDLNGSTPNLYIYTALCTVIITALLVIEARDSRRATLFLVSWTPLTISLILDAVNHYVGFSDIHFYNFGIAVTMIYQIVNLVFDLKKQYKEAIRYQQMQKELYEAKVSVMVSQVQPHFMYNALTSIAMMCSIDPETAQEATVTFAKYLRGNMDALRQTKPIPFAQELEHLKKYLYIEKLRFGKKLDIVYDIRATDFVLPQLSIQPLVENAVKHGVGMKKQGGTVTISTRETEDAFEVIISDDGVGFDTTAEKKDDGRSHVGMENTQRRLRDMCGGEVRIKSTVGEGTTATVILPKKGQNNENTVS